MEKITYPQIKKIYGLAKQAKLNDDELHDLVQVVTRSTSIKALSKNQAIKVIDRLTSLLKGYPPTRATPNQIWQINKLAEELGWKSDPRRLRHFLENRLHVSHPSYLSPEAASKTIEALKNMKRRAREKGSSVNG
ncbi:phage protein GemA/Gp16 family protein [Paenibacillus sanguinis]|uniref:phage protein GemA/Gp16 family protein n=1 Tax=Paenibacillus sanguinis TaxID=225906 RepID=UPI0003778523|nr:phage protein GemA/Gp16 family protein [Paenibacillus sanguinis]